VNNPWKKVKENIIYKNKFGFTLRDDDVITPAGKPGKYMVLESNGYAVVVALTVNKKLIMVRQWRYPLEKESYEVPAGAINKDEDSLISAKRELLEEVGGKTDNWHLLGSHWLGNGAMKIKGYIYLAQDVKISKSNQEDTENIEVELANFNDVYKMVINNEISDYRTKLAILLTRNYLMRGKSGA